MSQISQLITTQDLIILNNNSNNFSLFPQPLTQNNNFDPQDNVESRDIKLGMQYKRENYQIQIRKEIKKSILNKKRFKQNNNNDDNNNEQKQKASTIFNDNIIQNNTNEKININLSKNNQSNDNNNIILDNTNQNQNQNFKQQDNLKYNLIDEPEPYLTENIILNLTQNNKELSDIYSKELYFKDLINDIQRNFKILINTNNDFNLKNTQDTSYNSNNIIALQNLYYIRKTITLGLDKEEPLITVNNENNYFRQVILSNDSFVQMLKNILQNFSNYPQNPVVQLQLIETLWILLHIFYFEETSDFNKYLQTNIITMIVDFLTPEQHLGIITIVINTVFNFAFPKYLYRYILIKNNKIIKKLEQLNFKILSCHEEDIKNNYIDLLILLYNFENEKIPICNYQISQEIKQIAFPSKKMFNELQQYIEMLLQQMQQDNKQQQLQPHFSSCLKLIKLIYTVYHQKNLPNLSKQAEIYLLKIFTNIELPNQEKLWLDILKFLDKYSLICPSYHMAQNIDIHRPYKQIDIEKPSYKKKYSCLVQKFINNLICDDLSLITVDLIKFLLNEINEESRYEYIEEIMGFIYQIILQLTDQYDAQYIQEDVPIHQKISDQDEIQQLIISFFTCPVFAQYWVFLLEFKKPPYLIYTSLEVLDQILQWCENARISHQAFKDEEDLDFPEFPNQMKKTILNDSEFLSTLQELQNHSIEKIFIFSSNIIEKYFEYE